MKIKALIFDTETTGLPLAYIPAERDLNNYPFVLQFCAKLIEIDLDNLDEPIKLIYSINSLVKPYRKGKLIEIHPKAQAVHGITIEQCKQEGNDIATIALIFQGLTNSADVLVAHNYFFDRNVLVSELLNLGIEPKAKQGCKSLCTMKISTDVLKIPQSGKHEFKFPSLAEAFKFYTNGENIEDHHKTHDAEGDVDATIHVLLEIIKTHPKVKGWLKKEIAILY